MVWVYLPQEGMVSDPLLAKIGPELILVPLVKAEKVLFSFVRAAIEVLHSFYVTFCMSANCSLFVVL